jgi:hypothetical protein
MIWPHGLTAEEERKLMARDGYILYYPSKILLFPPSPLKQISAPQSDESLTTMGARAYKRLQRMRNEP